MQTLMREQPFVGVEYEGQSFDCGSKIGFLTANVAYALDRDDIADDFLDALTTLRLDAALSEGFRNAAE